MIWKVGGQIFDFFSPKDKQWNVLLQSNEKTHRFGKWAKYFNFS